MKQIIFFAPALRGGGAERVMVTLANKLIKKGYSVSFALTLNNEIEYDLDSEISVEINKKSTSMLGQIKYIRGVLKRKKNIVAISFFTFQNMYLLMANIGLFRKVIVSERNDPSKTLYRKKWMSGIRTLLYLFANRIVFQTEEAQNYFPKYIAKKGVIIGNPLREDLPEVYQGIRENKLVAFSRLNKQKNIPMMLEAVKIVFEKFPKYKLEIYGEGPELEYLEKYSQDIGIYDKVEFKGFIKNVLDDIRNATAFLSTSDYEGISNSMLEALAVGLPSICTDCPCGGARMYIEHKFNGMLVPVGDISTMAESMLQVIENDYFRDKLSKNAIKIRGKLSAEKIVEQWEKIVSECSNNR